MPTAPRFKSRINLNQRKFQYIEWRKNIVQIFNFCDFKGKYFLDLPYNMFHTLISTGLLKIKNNKEKIKILRKWNEVILNIYSLDGYVTMFINSLDETNSYELYKEICDFFYKKDNTHEEIREIIKQNRIQACYNISNENYILEVIYDCTRKTLSTQTIDVSK